VTELPGQITQSVTPPDPVMRAFAPTTLRVSVMPGSTRAEGCTNELWPGAAWRVSQRWFALR
jgi:hypothetical protein